MNENEILVFFRLRILNIFVPVYNIAVFYSVHVHTNRNTYFLCILHVSSRSYNAYFEYKLHGWHGKKKIPDVTERTFNRSIFYIIYASISIEVSSQRLNLSHNLSWLDNKKKICSQVIKIIRVSFNFRCIRVLK